MAFLLNDLSMHGQFDNIEGFLAALDRIMAARQRIEQQRLTLRCHRGLMTARINANATLQQAVRAIANKDKKRRILAWITKHGPFWDDAPLYNDDYYFELKGREEKDVTATAVGEAAMHLLQGRQRNLVSFTPSSWEYTPVQVDRVGLDGNRSELDIPNVWTQEQLAQALEALRRPVQSWRDLVQWAAELCPNLVLGANVIDPLDGWPFLPNAVERIQVLLGTLNRLKQCFGTDGGFNQEGKEIHANHFVGDKAWFTDSSTGEKRDFANELTFPHPERPGERLFCPWHGKIKTPQLRIHFSYPIKQDEPLYVVYIGPKLTKR